MWIEIASKTYLGRIGFSVTPANEQTLIINNNNNNKMVEAEVAYWFNYAPVPR